MYFVIKLAVAAVVIFHGLVPQIALAQDASSLPALSTYFQQNDLQYIKTPSQSKDCAEVASVSLDESDPQNPALTIDRMPIEDSDCIPKQPQTRRYKPYKRFSACGKVVYTDRANQSLQIAQLIIIDNRTGTCDDEHLEKAEVVIREATASGADFFKIR